MGPGSDELHSGYGADEILTGLGQKTLIFAHGQTIRLDLVLVVGAVEVDRGHFFLDTERDAWGTARLRR